MDRENDLPLASTRAVEFVEMLQSGRNRPGIFRCENADGASAGDYVVKLKGSLQADTSAFAFEGLGSALAQRLGINTPTASVVAIDEELAQAVDVSAPEIAGVIRRSIGANFGSEFLTGFRTFAIGEAIPSNLREQALNIFAFDALIQNPDRRSYNPNLLVGSSAYYVIDHELAFSFMLDALPGARLPWEVASLPFLREHAFYARLKRLNPLMSAFTEALKSITEPEIDTMMDEIPVEWRGNGLQRIKDHLLAVRDHADHFCEQVMGALQ